MAFLLTCSNWSLYFLCWGQSTPVESCWSELEGKNALPQPHPRNLEIRSKRNGKGSYWKDQSVPRFQCVFSLFFHGNGHQGQKKCLYCWQTHEKRSSGEAIRLRGIAAAKENGGLCISRVKLLGRSCKGIMQIPDWVSGGWLPEQGMHTLLYLGSDYANYTPPARVQGNWLNEKNSGSASLNAQRSARTSPRAVQGKHKHTALPPPLPGIHPTPACRAGNASPASKVGVLFHFPRVSHQRDGKWKLRWKLVRVAGSFLIPGKCCCLSKERCICTVDGLSFAL